MRFSQAQIRNALGISVETFRHWKRVLPPLAEQKKYSAGDLLAAAVFQGLTEQCGIRVGYLSEIAATIFITCNASAWASLQTKMLIVDLKAKNCVLLKKGRGISFDNVVVVFPLAGIIARIQDVLSTYPDGAQHHLHLPPVLVSGRRPQRQSV